MIHEYTKPRQQIFNLSRAEKTNKQTNKVIYPLTSFVVMRSVLFSLWVETPFTNMD